MEKALPTTVVQPAVLRNKQFQYCFIRRCQTLNRFQLCEYLKPGCSSGQAKVLLTARKIKRATCNEYIIYSTDDDRSKGTDINMVGKLRSDSPGTTFTLYKNQLLQDTDRTLSCADHKCGWRVGSDKISPQVPTRPHEVARIAKDVDEKGGSGVMCSLQYTNPSSPMHLGKPAPKATKFSASSFLKSVRSWLLNKASWASRRERLPSWMAFYFVPGTELDQPPSPMDNRKKFIGQLKRISERDFNINFCSPLDDFSVFALFLCSVDTKFDGTDTKHSKK